MTDQPNTSQEAWALGLWESLHKSGLLVEKAIYFDPHQGWVRAGFADIEDALQDAYDRGVRDAGR